jgi:hypothetical protein
MLPLKCGLAFNGRHYMPEGRTLCNSCRENLRSYHDHKYFITNTEIIYLIVSQEKPIYQLTLPSLAEIFIIFLSPFTYLQKP